MLDYIDYGPVPYGEECEQLGDRYDAQKARAECAAYVSQLYRLFGERKPDGVTLVIKSNPHDFGTYLSVCARVNDDNEQATEFAYDIEDELPEFWDTEAIEELNKKGYDVVSNSSR